MLSLSQVITSTLRRRVAPATASRWALGMVVAGVLAACGGTQRRQAPPPPTGSGGQPTAMQEESETVRVAADSDDARRPRRRRRGRREVPPTTAEPMPTAVDESRAEEAAEPPELLVGPRVSDDLLGVGWTQALGGTEPMHTDCPGVSARDTSETAVLPVQRVQPGLYRQVAPRSAQLWAYLQGTGVASVDQPCALRPDDDRYVAEVLTGSVVIARGDAPTSVSEPSPAAIEEAGMEIVTVTGWQLDDGIWHRTPRAVGMSPRPIPELAHACRATPGLPPPRALLETFLTRELASTGPRNATVVAARAPAGADELTRLTSRWLTAPDPEAAADSLDAIEALADRCDPLPYPRLVEALYLASADLTEDAIVSFGVARQRLGAPELSLALATLHARAGDLAGVADALDAWEEAGASHPVAFLLAFRLATEPDDLPSSLDALSPAAHAVLNHDVFGAAFQFELGAAYEEIERYDLAQALYERAAASDPSFAAPVNALGYLAYRDDRHDEALAYFDQAISRDPRFADAWNNAGFLLEHELGEIERAQERYRRAIEVEPRNGAAWFNLGRVLERHLGDLVAAAEAYERATSAEPTNDTFSRALSGLLARPEATADQLLGVWEASVVTPDSSSASVTATFLANGQLTVVERGPQRAGTTRYEYDVVGHNGAQLRLALRSDGVRSPMVIEFLDDTRFVMFHPDNPATTRLIFHKQGGRETLLAPPIQAAPGVAMRTGAVSGRAALVRASRRS